MPLHVTATLTARMWEDGSTANRLSTLVIESVHNDPRSVNIRVQGTVFTVKVDELREAVERCDLSRSEPPTLPG